MPTYRIEAYGDAHETYLVEAASEEEAWRLYPDLAGKLIASETRHMEVDSVTLES